MRILFCNIARMKYYKGIVPGTDEPKFGGAYVAQTGDASEKYNFAPIQAEDGECCLGTVETSCTLNGWKEYRGMRGQQTGCWWFGVPPIITGRRWW